MIIYWKAVDKYFTVVPFVVQFYPVCNFGKFINFGLDTVRSERVKIHRGKNCLKRGQSRCRESVSSMSFHGFFLSLQQYFPTDVHRE